MRTEIARATAVGFSFAAFQLTFVAVGMELAEAFLVGLAAILAVLNDVVFAVYIHSAVAIHRLVLLC